MTADLRLPPAVSTLVTTLAARLIAVIAAFGSGVLVARGLGPAGRGTYALITTVALMAATVSHLSVEQAIVGRWRRDDETARLSGTSVIIGAIFGSFGGLAALLVLTTRYGDSVVGGAAWLAAVGVPLFVVSLYVNSTLVLNGRLGRSNSLRVVGALTQLAAVVGILLVSTLSVTGAVAAWAVALAVPSLGGVASQWRDLRAMSFGAARRLLSVGLRYHPGMLALSALSRLDVFIVAAFAGRSAVGLYAVAVTLAEGLFLVSDSVAQVALGRQVQLDRRESDQLTLRVARMNLMVCLTASVALAVASPIVIPILFGQAYAGSVASLLLLLPGILGLALIRPITAQLVRRDRPLLVSSITVSALALNLLLNFVLVPHLAERGAAIASSLAYLWLAAAYLLIVGRSAGWRPVDFICKPSDFGALLPAGWRSPTDPVPARDGGRPPPEDHGTTTHPFATDCRGIPRGRP